MASSNTAAYASAIVATVGGVKQYIQVLTGGVVGVAAKDGKLLWLYDGDDGQHHVQYAAVPRWLRLRVVQNPRHRPAAVPSFD